jgi:hypothetical protein
MCIRYGHEVAGDRVEAAEQNESRPKERVGTSILRGWYTGTYAEIINTKRGHMVGFKDNTVEEVSDRGVAGKCEEARTGHYRGVVCYQGSEESCPIQ